MIAVLAGVISYATLTRTTMSSVQQIQGKEITPESTDAAKKEKPCDCCKDRIARIQEQIRKARERKQAAQGAETKEIVSQQKP